MELLQPIGDAIANLQVDATGKKPSNTEALFNLLDKLKTNEGYESSTTTSSQKSASRGLMSCVKPSILIALLGVGLTTPQVQLKLANMFPKSTTRYGIVALILLVCSILIIKKTS
jgi:hypothetical protein